MKKRYMLTAFIVIIATTLAYAAQIESGANEKPRIQEFKSIHQTEWERHKNFVRREKIPAFQGPPMALAPRKAAPNKEIFGYLPYWVYSDYPNLNYDLLTTIAYFGAEVNSQGNLTGLRDWPASGLINKAHSEGVRVVLTAVNFSSNAIASVLSNADRRANLISNLLTQVQVANADGVNIDFEGVPSSQRGNLTTFMAELTDAFHSMIPGSFVTIFTPSVDWSDAFDYFSLAQITDGLVISGYGYHWSTAPTAGPVSPLTGTRWGFYNLTWTVDDYLSKTLSPSKLILGLPFYGYEWPTESDALEARTTDAGDAIYYSEAYPNAMQFGRLWDEESQSPWYKYNDGQWHQGWYDDSLSLAKKFEFVIDLDLKGVGIWALSYDGDRQELQAALAEAFGSTAPPLKPTAFRVLNIGDARVQITGQPSSGATGYQIYTSRDGENFSQGTEFPGASNILSNLSPDSTYYFKMSAVNGNGESNLTEVLTVRPTREQVSLLIVNGFDRTTGTVNTFDFVKRFAPSVAKKGYAFDSCANEAIENGEVLLTQYEIVLWIAGEEGTATESLSQTEQSLLAEFLETGGSLFISGSEIGYDLVEQGGSADKDFYRTYLKALYVRDKVDTHSASGTSEGIFTDVPRVTFDDGLHGTYNVDFPDGIMPVDGAVLSMTYEGFNEASFGGAGIEYAGPFANATVAGRLVYLGFPFETIYPESSRDAVMNTVLEFLDRTPTSVETPVTVSTGPNEFELAQNYPNPFNPSTNIAFQLTNSVPLLTKLQIYNLRGREIITLIDEPKSAGRYSVQWDGLDRHGDLVASGTYIYRLQVGVRVQAKKMTLLR